MINQSQEGFSPLSAFNRCVLLKGSVAFLSGFSLLSSGLVLTQQRAIATDNVFVIPETSAPPATQAPVIIPKSAPQVAPVKDPIVKPVAPLKPRTIKIEPKPTIGKPTNYAAPKVQLSAPRISVPEVKRTSSPIIPQVKINNQDFSTGVDTGKNSYIDTTQYNASPKNYSAPAAVVLTERSTGCQTVSQNGQLSGGCGLSARRQSPQQTTAFSRKQRSPQAIPPRNLAVARNLTVVRQSNSVAPASRNLIAANQTKMMRIAQSGTRPQPIYSPPAIQPINSRPQGVSDSQVVSLQPIEMNGLKIALAPVPRYNRAANTGNEVAPRAGKTDLLFPLAIPARISSAFGWRVHPIAGSGRMHEGTDIAAPIGTPVLAAYSGLVAFADWSGGYGQMVILRHLDGNQESRYAHLSEIFVQPGQQVEQGAVIGTVGSTGLSTGPHLHFEWRYLTQQGWVAVDAGVHLEYALDNLIQSMPVAKTTTNKEG